MSIKNLSGILALVLIGSIPAQAALTMADGGKSGYEIVVSKDALPITLRAAQDLQDYVQKATGAKIEITRADAPGAKPAIVVGEGPAAKALGVNLDGVKAEGFRIKTVGKNLVIAGKDTPGSPESDHWMSAPQAGTWNGVCRFLEKEIGIRWFFPGKDGEYVPRMDKLVVAEQDYRDAPSMIYRRMAYTWSTRNPASRIRDVRDWQRRNGNGWSIIWSGSHTWIENFKAETYSKDHPEWFALVNGVRQKESWHGPQMCTTNPGALDEFARVITDYGKKYPGVMFSLSPNDGGGFCECANCRALDRLKLPSGMPVLSDRIVTYANETAKRVNKVLPDQVFGLYAYSYYADPPTYARVDPHVYIMEVENDINTLYHSAEFRDYHLNKRLLAWKKMTNNLFFYSHPEGFGGMGLPSMHEGVLKSLYANLDRAGVKGYSMNHGTGFGASGLNNYLSLKMAWNPKADIDAIYADALSKCYGEKGAPFIRKYFDAVESRWGRYTSKALKAQDVAMGTVRIFPDSFDVVFQGLYEEGMPLIEKALSLAKDDGQKARIMLLKDNLEFTRMTVDLYNLSKKVIGVSNPSKEDVLKARDLAKKRIEYVNSHADSNNFTTADEVFGVEKMWSLPFNPQVYDFLLLKASGGKSSASVAAVKSAPVVDGDLSDAAWQGAQELQINLRKDDASKSDIATTAKLVRDASNIYIAVRCTEPLVEQIKDQVTVHDGPVWNENEVEVFFDPVNAKKGFKQILVNSLGTITDVASDNGKGAPWESGAKAAVKKGADFWALEMSVPVSSLTANPVQGGDIWGFNICRVRHIGGVHEYTCWSPTFGLFGQPDRFGNLIMK